MAQPDAISSSSFWQSVPAQPADADADRLAGQQRLRVALLALLPSDGTPVTVARLAEQACVGTGDVTDALFDDYLAGRIGFHVRTDQFFSIKQGDQL